MTKENSKKVFNREKIRVYDGIVKNQWQEQLRAYILTYKQEAERHIGKPQSSQ